jgi:hypothetical protein
VKWVTSAGDGLPLVAGSDCAEAIYFVDGGEDAVLDSTEGIEETILCGSWVLSIAWERFFLCFSGSQLVSGAEVESGELTDWTDAACGIMRAV